MKALSQQCIENLIKLASTRVVDEQGIEDIEYYFECETDIAYEGGVRDGNILLARDILKELGIPFELEEAMGDDEDEYEDGDYD